MRWKQTKKKKNIMDREDSMETFSLSFFKNLFLSLVNEKRKLNNNLQTILLSGKYDMTSIYLYGSLVKIYSAVILFSGSIDLRYNI